MKNQYGVKDFGWMDAPVSPSRFQAKPIQIRNLDPGAGPAWDRASLLRLLTRGSQKAKFSR
jgi:hypothetical protein